MIQRTETKLFLTVFLIYGFYVTMTDEFNNVDALCVAMVDRGTFEIDQRVMSDYAVVHGTKYSGHSPGASWVLAPLYLVLKPLCSFAPRGFQFQAFSMLASCCLSITLGALCVVCLYRLLKTWGLLEGTATITALAFAFGTMWFVYGRRHNSYSFISSALVFLAFYGLERSAHATQQSAAFLSSGFLAFLGVATDYKQALSVFWLCLYVVLRHRAWRSWVCFGLGALLPMVAMLGYDWHVFGHPLYTPAKFEVANNKLEESLQPGVIPLQGALHFKLTTFLALLIGLHTGFFLYVPVMLLALAGILRYRARKPPSVGWALLVTAGIFLSNAVLSASLSSYWHGGGSGTYYGPATRYLLCTVPFLMIFVAFAVERMRTAVTYTLIGLSVAITWMFVVSASYGVGASPMQPGWKNLPLIVHGKHILATFGAESVWFNFLASSHFAIGTAGAAAITWCAAAGVGLMVWLVWRAPKAP